MKKKVIAIVAVLALVVILTTCLVACNADSYTKKLEKAGYEVEAMDEEDFEELEEALGTEYDTSWSLAAAKDDDLVMIVCFENKDDAKSFEEDANGLKTILKMIGITDVDRSGKIVFLGTEQGVKDAK